MRKYSYEPAIKYNHHIEAITGIVKVIDNNGEFVGEMPIREALRAAFDRDLDLVQISYEQMPVCKICDVNKYKYEVNKKNKQKKQNTKPTQIKVIKLSINIEKSHLELKLKQAREFLEEGHKVNISVRLRGREMSQASVALAFFDEIVNRFKGEWSIDKPPVQMGREISMSIGRKLINKKEDTKEAIANQVEKTEEKSEVAPK